MAVSSMAKSRVPLPGGVSLSDKHDKFLLLSLSLLSYNFTNRTFAWKNNSVTVQEWFSSNKDLIPVGLPLPDVLFAESTLSFQLPRLQADRPAEHAASRSPHGAPLA